MWILAVQGRQYWLLPGRRYNVGRSTKKQDGTTDIVIQESSVSRKHLVLEVVAATDDAISHPSVRSNLYITDLGSRFGTTLDGHRLAANESTPAPFNPAGSLPLKVGSFIKATLKWKMFVITYSIGQPAEAYETMWNHALTLLKPLDVKLLPYLVQNTAVVVKAGATTSTVYFALASGKPIANSHYLQALHDAAVEASDKGREGPLMPELAPYNPDPAWKPDPRRKTCLAGQTFYSSNEERAAFLKPLIEAAGGLYTDSPGALWIVHTMAETSQLPQGTAFIEITSVFTAISESRGIRAAEIRETTIPEQQSKITTPERQSEAALVSSPTKKQNKPLPSSSSPRQSQTAGRSRHARVNFFGALTSKEPPAAFDGQPAREQQPVAQASIAKEHDAEKTKHSRSVVLESRQIPKVSKRPIMDAKAPPRKRIRRDQSAVEPEADHDAMEITTVEAPELDLEPEDDSIAVADYSKIGELAIVEDVLDTSRENARVRPVSNQDWSGRSNFKGFKKARRAHTSRRVEYDADVPDNALSDEASAAPASVRLSSPSLRTALRAGALASRDQEEDSEESLFVSSNPEDALGELPTNTSSTSSRARSRLANELTVDGDEDGFSFRFS